jgi:hypothetical protein
MTEDLLAEYRALADFCAMLSSADWRRVSAFYGWTPWDEIAYGTSCVNAGPPARD